MFSPTAFPTVNKGPSTTQPHEAAPVSGRLQDSETIGEEVDVSVVSQPLALVSHTVVDQVNEMLEGDFGSNTNRPAGPVGQDPGPESTARRILNFAGGQFEAFREQNPALSRTEAADDFINMVSQGVSQGFEEARNVLAGLGALEGESASQLDDTFQLVQEGLARFTEQQSDG